MLHSHTPESPATIHVKVDTAGRVLIPVSVRTQHNIKVGDTVAIVSDPKGVALQTRQQIMREVQEYYKSLAPAEQVWSEELIQERRREAAAEAEAD